MGDFPLLHVGLAWKISQATSQKVGNRSTYFLSHSNSISRMPPAFAVLYCETELLKATLPDMLRGQGRGHDTGRGWGEGVPWLDFSNTNTHHLLGALHIINLGA